MNQKD